VLFVRADQGLDSHRLPQVHPTGLHSMAGLPLSRPQQTVHTPSMAATHKCSAASVTVASKLPAERLAEICNAAAFDAGGRSQSVRLETAIPGCMTYSIRTHSVIGIDVELMVFRVVLSSDVRGRKLSSQITSFETRQQTFTPKELVSWRTYQEFMYQLATSVVAEDPTARTAVVERRA
jgi:hypothetical protein